ncbi:hypothetical protein [Sphingobium sp.]|uniref:hypothetical protein n=1 Tax=Sphingobium sp. TaxID=1912891 RepID=UPI0028BEE849|nr:hypothetical protein [Sphingobium sp.]
MSMTWGTGLLFAGGVAGQLVGVGLMPATKGLAAPLPTLGCAAAFLIGLGLLTRVIHSGAPLSLVVPLNAAAVPIGSLLMAIALMGETPSIGRVAALLIACALIGLANLL